ncbi:MAG: hypothetical protein ACM3N4_08420, partial [Nitrososphaerota archaeon]
MPRRRLAAGVSPSSHGKPTPASLGRRRWYEPTGVGPRWCVLVFGLRAHRRTLVRPDNGAHN